MTHAAVRAHALHGDLSTDGFRILTWQFHAMKDTRLEVSLRQDVTLLTVNISGRLELVPEGERVPVPPSHMMIRTHLEPQAQWVAVGAGSHRGIMVEFAGHLLKELQGSVVSPKAAQVAVHHPSPCADTESVSRLSIAVLTLAQQLSAPPAHSACLPIWFHAKVMELASLTLFAPEPPPSAMKSDLRRELLDRVLFLLEKDLENPPTLEMLAQEVGFGPFQLSRLFGKATGKTMPEFLRQKRMEKAALMLRTTRQSVSEIALAVGYESFSAFTRGFVRELGVTPTTYRAQSMAQARME